MKARRAIIVGASSGIGAELARVLVADGCRVALLARNEQRLEELTTALNTQAEPSSVAVTHDVTQLDTMPAAMETALSFLGGLDLVVYSAGVMFKPPERVDTEREEQMLRVNLLGAIGWLNLASSKLQELGGGTLVGIGSVAGDRGRSASPGYCASKAGLHAYLEGLRGQLHGTGVEVIVIKPGPVSTPMTEGIDAPMKIDVGRAAADIASAIRRGDPVVYIPRRWRAIMTAVQMIPPSLFKRLKV